MSHLARELERQLIWIEKRAQKLQEAVDQLLREGNTLTNNYETWDEYQADVIQRAISEWADACERAIAMAEVEVIEFGWGLSQANPRGVESGRSS